MGRHLLSAQNMGGFWTFHHRPTKQRLIITPMSKLWVASLWSTTKKLVEQQSPSRYHRRSRNAPQRPKTTSQGPLLISSRHSRRSFHLSSVLTPPAVFLGLLATLWAYKSLMLVVFQNKIIYMPSVPPFSRSEKIEDYAAGCRPVVWREARIRAADGTKLTLAVGEIPESVGELVSTTEQANGRKNKRVVVIYFQGYVVLTSLFPCSSCIALPESCCT